MPQDPAARERAAARAAQRRRRQWFSVASWATTAAIVAAVGALVHWRVTSVLREARRQRQAEAELDQAARLWRLSPGDLDAAAARFRAVMAHHPDTEAARKAQEALARIERLKARQPQTPRPAADDGPGLPPDTR
ncbi:MAG TPA: hypothetical protein PLE19_14055 [Planctomycetota bacterium]|nr:hypothetical protein [Planctomycetota bacterium]HRR79573.1 hypothetical protein [Planctomycetota bacterium]HRT94415.1 hypothetical protein [Planctomycetota bacterium]